MLHPGTELRTPALTLEEEQASSFTFQHYCGPEATPERAKIAFGLINRIRNEGSKGREGKGSWVSLNGQRGQSR